MINTLFSLFSVDAGENEDVSEEQQTNMSPIKEADSLNQQPSVEASSKEVPLMGQPGWEMEMEEQQGSPPAAFDSISSEEEAEDLRQSRDGEEGEKLVEDDIRTMPHNYDCVAMTTPSADKLEKTEEESVMSQSLSSPVELPVPSGPPLVPEQSDLFPTQTLQTVVTSCEMPDQRTALEGSQVGESVFSREVEVAVRSVRSGMCCCFLHEVIMVVYLSPPPPVNYNHWPQLRGPGVRGHPAQHGRRSRGGGHLHRHRGRHLQPGVLL